MAEWLEDMDRKPLDLTFVSTILVTINSYPQNKNTNPGISFKNLATNPGVFFLWPTKNGWWHFGKESIMYDRLIILEIALPVKVVSS